VAQVEVKIAAVFGPGMPKTVVRLVASDPTGFVLRVRGYVEVRQPIDGGMSMGITTAATADAAAAARRSSLTGPRTRRMLSPIAAGDSSSSSSAGVGGGSGSGSDPSSSSSSSALLAAAAPYPLAELHETARAVAASADGTLYAYDFLELFGAALKDAWVGYLRARDGGVSGGASASSAAAAAAAASSSSSSSSSSSTATAALDALLAEGPLLSSVELVLRPKGTAPGAKPPVNWSYDDTRPQDVEMVEEPGRAPGRNDIGMVAWRLTLRTPECPAGRPVVLISNDITHRAGSFGTREDLLFCRASELARSLGCPRIYIAANSGARIGVSTSVQRAFRVAWIDARAPEKGFRYLYVRSLATD